MPKSCRPRQKITFVNLRKEKKSDAKNLQWDDVPK